MTHLSNYEVREAIRSLILQGERAQRAMAIFSGAEVGHMVRLWQETIARYRTEAAQALIEREEWRLAADVVTRIRALADDDKIEVSRAQAADLLDTIAFSDGDERVKALRELAQTISLIGGAKKKWRSEDDLTAIKEALKQLREAARAERLLALEWNEADHFAIGVMSRLIRLYERASRRFAEEKEQQAWLDFNDLEVMTERLLTTREDVRALYATGKRLRALMVDEFQDTSPIQTRILQMIAPASDEVFIIGDAKQSIYRFRGADVTVFQEARADLEANAGKAIEMDACFRSHSRLIDFVNHLFPLIFTRESRYDTPYEAMRAWRQPFAERAAIEMRIIWQEKDAEEKLNSYQLREREAQLVAQRIKEIVAQKDVLVGGDQGEARAADYGDIALLFQASTHFDVYERALADAGLPYVTIAGKGFYGRQEILDISNLLAFLTNASDELSLAAALRSPMFAISDETLLRLRLDQQQSLWRSLFDDSIAVARDQKEAVEFAREALTSLRALVGRLSPAEIVTAAVRETGYLATLSALPHGDRRVANVEKMIEQTRALATMTLSDVVVRLKELKFREAREGEASVEESGAVRLMTVHKAKGLEFPIVWIVDAAYSGAADRSKLATHADLGVAINLQEDELTKDAPRPATFELIRLVEMQMDRAEKKRLLYVAVTRARDHLILSASLARTKLLGDHWLGRVARALGLEEEARPASVTYPDGIIDICWRAASGK